MHEGLVKSQQFCSRAAILWQDLQAHYPLGSAQSLAKYNLHRRTYQDAIIGYLMKSSQCMAEAVVKQLADTRFLSIDGYAIEQIAELLKQQKFLSPAAFLLLETCETGVMAEIQQAKNNFYKEKPNQALAASAMQASEDTIPLVSDGEVIPPLITEVKSRGLGNRQFHHWGHAV